MEEAGFLFEGRGLQFHPSVFTNTHPGFKLLMMILRLFVMKAEKAPLSSQLKTFATFFISAYVTVYLPPSAVSTTVRADL